MDKQIRIWSFAGVDRSGKVRWAAKPDFSTVATPGAIKWGLTPLL